MVLVPQQATPTPALTHMIRPRIFHYIWLGSKPMPPIMEQWRSKWEHLHPTWKTKVWRGAADTTILQWRDELVVSRRPNYLMGCPTIAKRSDVWRYDLLEQLGGVYLDTDFEPIKNIEPIVEDKSAFAGLCVTKYNWSKIRPEGDLKTEIGCSIIGATAHHPWLQDLFNNAAKQDLVAPLSLAFPYMTRITANHPEVHLFEPRIFYSVRWDEYTHLQSRYIKSPPREAYAVHRWSSLWFNNGIKSLPPGKLQSCH